MDSEGCHIFVLQNTTIMTTTTIPAVKLVENPTLRGDIFYGEIKFNLNGKPLSVGVSNLIKDSNKTYNFRVATKCRAGFITISDYPNSLPESIISNWKKNALVNIQIEREFENGTKRWFDVLTIKGNKWFSIDLGFLEVLTVGTMRQVFPTMCDLSLWEMVGAKTWADKAFTQN